MLTTTTAAQRCLCAGILTLALAACGGSGRGRPDGGSVAEPGPSTTTTSSVPTTAGNPQTAVIDAYRRYWATVDAYGSESAPFDLQQFKQTFAPVATGPQYDTLFDLFQLNRLKGWVYQGREGNQLRPRVVELSADRAVVSDCADDFGGIFDTKNNVFVEPLTPGQHTRFTAVLRFVDGAWKMHSQGGGDERCEV